jgi:hypothetical protein
MRQVITKKRDFVQVEGRYVLQNETLTHRINVFCDELLDWVRRFGDG